MTQSMETNELPPHMEAELKAMGVMDAPRVSKHAPVAWPKKKAIEYRTPTFDENGEPDF